MQWSGGARLGWHSPCACPAAALDVGGWCSGSRRRGCLGRSRRRYTVDDIYYDDEDDENQLAPLEGDYPAAGGTSSPRWRVLWRRIFRGKRRIFRSGSAAAPARRVPYDPYTYAHNFEDPGSTWMEGVDLDRSFSARFADPSRVIRSIA